MDHLAPGRSHGRAHPCLWPASPLTNSALDYLVLGVRASIGALIFSMAPPALVLGGIIAVTKKMLPFVKRWAGSGDGAAGKLHRRLRRIGEAVRSTSPEVRVVSLFAISLVVLALAVFAYADLWRAIAVLLDEEVSRGADLSILGSRSTLYDYAETLGALIVAISITAMFTFGSLEEDHRRRAVVRLMRAGTIGVVLVAAVLMFMPWNLLYGPHELVTYEASARNPLTGVYEENPERWIDLDGRRVDLFGRSAYIIAQTDSAAWIYFSELRHRRRVELRFLGRSNNVTQNPIFGGSAPTSSQ